MREITVNNATESELRAALDAQELEDVVVTPGEGGGMTVEVPDDVDGERVDDTLRRAVSERLDAAVQFRAYVALLSQSGTDDPVVTVMKNTLGGEVVWTRNAVGVYDGRLAGAFRAGRTGIVPGAVDLVTNATATFIARIDDDAVYLQTADVSALPTVTSTDNVLSDTLVDIRVYDI